MCVCVQVDPAGRVERSPNPLLRVSIHLCNLLFLGFKTVPVLDAYLAQSGPRTNKSFCPRDLHSLRKCSAATQNGVNSNMPHGRYFDRVHAVKTSLKGRKATKGTEERKPERFIRMHRIERFAGVYLLYCAVHVVACQSRRIAFK